MDTQRYLEALKNVMEKRFPATDYCIGGYQEEAVCIQPSQNGWLVYCGERGNHYEQVECDTVLSACLVFIRKMTHIKDDIINMENDLLRYIAQAA